MFATMSDNGPTEEQMSACYGSADFLPYQIMTAKWNVVMTKQLQVILVKYD
eukprot:UN12153